MWGDGMIVVLNDRQFGKNLRFLRRRHRYSRWELANLLLPQGHPGLGNQQELRRGCCLPAKYQKPVRRSGEVPDRRRPPAHL